MKELRNYLMSIIRGAIKNTAELERLLAGCWDEFEGSETEGMAPYKLHGRMEDVVWDPPNLFFTLERHGETVLGSTRAELHNWKINIQDETANCYESGHRQVYPMQPSLDLRPIAEGIVQLIVDHKQDQRLKWGENGSVRILVSRIIPGEHSPKQTLTGRRKRFRETLDKLLTEDGWRKIRVYVYAPPDNLVLPMSPEKNVLPGHVPDVRLHEDRK